MSGRHRWFKPPCEVKGTRQWLEANFQKLEHTPYREGEGMEDETEQENPQVCEREGLRQDDGVLRPAPGSKTVRHRKGKGVS